MKKITKFLFLILIGLSNINMAQSQDESFCYVTKEAVEVYSYDFSKDESIQGSKKIANPNLKFRLIGKIKSDKHLGQIYVIQFWKITNEAAELTSDNTKINKNSTSNNQYYCIKAEDFKEPNIYKRYFIFNRYNGKPNIGTLVVPLKFRTKRGNVPFDFTTDFTLGSSFGYSFRISRYQPNYLNLIGAFGLTSVAVDSTTTNGYVKQNTKMSSATPGIGLIADISGFQIGAVIGWDIIGGITGKNWIYNSKSWYSFGIGYQFLKKDENKSPK